MVPKDRECEEIILCQIMKDAAVMTHVPFFKSADSFWFQFSSKRQTSTSTPTCSFCLKSVDCLSVFLSAHTYFELKLEKPSYCIGFEGHAWFFRDGHISTMERFHLELNIFFKIIKQRNN